jgi:hypothetical protein
MTTSPKSQHVTGNTFGGIAGLIVALLFVLGVPGVGFRWLMHDSHWIHQEKLMYVYAEGWAVGEYKDCVSLNVDLEEPSLTCDAAAKGKTFKVRFDGDTYVKGKPDSTASHWKCRKFDVDDATIDCEFRSVQAAVVDGENAKEHVSKETQPGIWTSEDEPPGKVLPNSPESCPAHYKLINHLSAVGGYLRHVDCVPVTD